MQQMRHVIIVSVAIIVVVLSMCSVVQCKRVFEHLERPLILSHRGSRELNPENTLTAFHTGLQLGGHVVEFDVRLSSDNVLVVYHDEVIDRTTSAKGPVRSYTVQQLQSVDAAYHYKVEDDDGMTVYPYRDKHIQIPTLRQVLDALWGGEQVENDAEWINMNIEIKDDDLVAVDKLIEELERFDMKIVTKHVAVVSRFCNVIEYFRKRTNKAIPTVACEAEVTKFVFRTWFIDWVRSTVSFLTFQSERVDKLLFGRLYSQPDYSCMQIPMYTGGVPLMTPEIVAAAKRQNTEIYYWVPNTAEDMLSVMRLNADGIITDRTDRAVSLFKEWNMYHTPVHHNKKSSSTVHYHVPKHDHFETHECVTIFCVLMRHLKAVLAATLLISTILTYQAVYCLCIFADTVQRRQQGKAKFD